MFIFSTNISSYSSGLSSLPSPRDQKRICPSCSWKQQEVNLGSSAHDGLSYSLKHTCSEVSLKDVTSTINSLGSLKHTIVALHLCGDHGGEPDMLPYCLGLACSVADFSSSHNLSRLVLQEMIFFFKSPVISWVLEMSICTWSSPYAAFPWLEMLLHNEERRADFPTEQHFAKWNAKKWRLPLPWLPTASHTGLHPKRNLAKLEVQFISTVRIDLLHHLCRGNECLHSAPIQSEQIFVFLRSPV